VLRRITQQRVGLWLVGAVTALLTIGPLVVLVLASVRPGSAMPFETSALTLGNYVEAFVARDTRVLVLNTLWYAIGSVAEGLVIAAALAWLTERTDIPGRRTIRTLMFVTMAIPPLVQSFGWILLLNPGNGAFNVWLRAILGGRHGPLNIYTMGMMIFVSGLMLVPTMFVMLAGVFRNMNPQLENAALMSGATRLRTTFRITLPLLAPGLLSVVIYVFIIMIQVFDTPLSIGLTAGIPVLSTRIYLLSSPEQTTPRYNLAAAFGVTLLLVASVLIWLYFRATRHGERYRVVTGKAYRPTPLALGAWRPAALAVVVLYCLVALAPILILAWTSLLPFYAVPGVAALERLTLENYVSVTGLSLVRRALGNTVIVTVATATLTMALACLVSWFSVRSRTRGTKVLELLAFSPLAIPHIVMAIALLLLYVRTPLYGTIWVIVLGLVTVNLAFGTRTMSAAMLQVHEELERAATASGASWLVGVRRILLPLLWPHVLNGWLGVLANSLRDLSVPMILMTTNNVVISSTLWLLWGYPNVPGAAAVSMIMILGLLVIAVPIQARFAPASERGR
jgi:iron(III) transport system permease protein